MKIIIDKATITQCHLTRSENIVLRYLCDLSLHKETRQKVLLASKDGRRKIFLCAMEKLFEVLEANRAEE